MPELYINGFRDRRVADLNVDRVRLSRLIILFAAADRDVIGRNALMQLRNIDCFCGCPPQA